MDSSQLEILRKTRRKVTDKYRLLFPIGEGTFGVVWKAERDDGGIYAIKQFLNTQEEPGRFFTALREINILNEMSGHRPHDMHLVRLEDIVVDPDSKSIWLVFEYGVLDLYHILSQHSHNNRTPIPPSRIKSIMQQLLKGLAFLHNNWIFHRDIKPSNVLITMDGTVKITDFGLARIFQDPQRSLGDDGDVVTYCYRAPELLLHSEDYTQAIDVWSAGCIFAELLSLSMLFHGAKEEKGKNGKKAFQREQLNVIFRVLGTPSLEDWPGLADLPRYSEVSKILEDQPPRPSQLHNRVIGTDAHALDLLKKMLEYNPDKRVSALDALNHSYFTHGAPPEKINVKLYNIDRPAIKPTKFNTQAPI